MLTRFFVLFALTGMTFLSCIKNEPATKEDAGNQLSEQDTVIYHQALSEMGLDSADSVVLEYWTDSSENAKRINLIPEDGQVLVSILYTVDEPLFIQVRVYDKGKLMASGAGAFDEDQHKILVKWTLDEEDPLHLVLSIKDTLYFNEFNFTATLDSCAIPSKSSIQKLEACTYVMPDTGHFQMDLFFTDSTGAKREQKAEITVVLGIPVVNFQAFSGNPHFNEAFTFMVLPVDSNGAAEGGYIREYRWDFNNDGAIDTITKVNTASTIFTKVQKETKGVLRVVIVDDDGNEAEGTLEYTLQNEPPSFKDAPDSLTAFPYDTVSLGGYSLFDYENNQVDSVAWHTGNMEEDQNKVVLPLSQKFVVTQKQLGRVLVYGTMWDELGAKYSQLIIVNFKADVIRKDTIVTPGKGYFLDPLIEIPENQTIKSCEWSFGGGAFLPVGNSCDTIFTAPLIVGVNYKLISRVTTSTNAVVLDTIQLESPAWNNFAVQSIPLRFKDGPHSTKVVRLGDQIWFAQDLGIEVPNSVDCPAIIGDVGTVAYCGQYYDWATAMDGESASSANPSGVQGLCPDGWHLPSDAEWEQLRSWVSSIEGYKSGTDLKDTSSMYWVNFSSSPLRKSGNTNFGAQPAGYYNEDGKIQWLGSGVKYWSASVDTRTGSKGYPWTRTLMGKPLGVTEFPSGTDRLDQEYSKLPDELLRESSDRNNPKQKMLVRCLAD